MSNLAGTFKSTFKSVAASDGSFTTILTGSAQSSYLIECDVSCTGDTGVQVSVRLRRPAANGSPESSAFLIKGAPVPQGSALQIIDGQKVVLQQDDVLEVRCETQGQSVDVIVSYVDHVNLD